MSYWQQNFGAFGVRGGGGGKGEASVHLNRDIFYTNMAHGGPLAKAPKRRLIKI